MLGCSCRASDPGRRAPDGRRDVGVIPLSIGGQSTSRLAAPPEGESEAFTRDPRSQTALPSHQSVPWLLTLVKQQVDHVDPW